MYINLVSMRTCTHSSFFACYHVPVTSNSDLLTTTTVSPGTQGERNLSIKFWVLCLKNESNWKWDRQTSDRSECNN